VPLPFGVGGFYLLNDLEQARPARNADRLERGRDGEADRFFRAALVRHDEIRAQRVEPARHALDRGVERFEIDAEIHPVLRHAAPPFRASIQPLPAPLLHGEQHRIERAPFFRERIVDRHRDGRDDLPRDDAVVLEVPQRVRQRFGADIHGPAELAEAHRAQMQLLEHQKRPFSAEHIHHLPDAPQAHRIIGLHLRCLP